MSRATLTPKAKGYRKVRAGSHIIFFKVTTDGIDVVRILHQKMDFNRHL